MPILNIDSEFGYVILATAAIQFQVAIAAFGVGTQRRKHGVKYPDMTGKKLEGKAWEEFNNYQRVHQNYLESLTSVTTNLLIGGLFYPKVQAGLALGWMLGRYLYARGYTKVGPEGRILGAGLGFLFNFSMMATVIYSGFRLLGYA